MNSEAMARMSAAELDAYARAMGFTAAAGKTAEDKIRIIEAKRSREVTVTVLGTVLSIPVKRAHDKRFSELMGKRPRTDGDVEEAFRILLGDEQFDELYRAATDEDGTLDEAAIAYAFSALLGNADLKNF